MLTKYDVEAIWKDLDDWQLDIPTPGEDLCVFAEHFATWAQPLCAQIEARPSIEGIHQAMLLNTMKYHEMRPILPKAHRNHVGERGHICVFHLYERTFHFLKMKLLALPEHATLMLPKPVPPPPPPPPQIAGVPFGIIKE